MVKGLFLIIIHLLYYYYFFIVGVLHRKTKYFDVTL